MDDHDDDWRDKQVDYEDSTADTPLPTDQNMQAPYFHIAPSPDTERAEGLREQIAAVIWQMSDYRPGESFSEDQNVESLTVQIMHLITQASLDARWKDYLFMADALMDRRIGSDAALRELEARIKGLEKQKSAQKGQE